MACHSVITKLILQNRNLYGFWSFYILGYTILCMWNHYITSCALTPWCRVIAYQALGEMRHSDMWEHLQQVSSQFLFNLIYFLCASRPDLGNDTSLPPCQEYVEENPRLQVGPNQWYIIANIAISNTSLPHCQEYVEENPRLQVALPISSQMKEYSSHL